MEEFPMKRMLTAFCCIALAAVPALSQAKKGGAMTDQQFVDFAAQTDMVEANLGQMAKTKSSTQAVEDMGQMLITDHTADYNQLGQIAKAASLNVPTAIGAEQNKMMIGPFSKLKGAAFDHKFATDMVAGHTKAIEVYKKEAADATSPDLKSYAEQTRPTLQKHLDAAKALGK
jgi:putative membrane protein